MATRTRPAGKGAAATKTRGSARKQAQEAEEFVEVSGGDFPPVWEFETMGDLVGVFLGTETILAKGKNRTIHTFEVDGETYNVWGTAILDSRLSDIDPQDRVKVIKTGEKIPTKSGNAAWEFKVLVARGAVAR